MLRVRYAGSPEELAVLLQAGFQIKAVVGCTLREFICMEMEICGDYANRRIQTILIDGQPVDDFDTAQINDGTRLALSGALPGLVGAMMRRGGDLSNLRDSITYHLDELRPHEARGMVHVKLFNFIAGELAHIFLRRGITVDSEMVRHVISMSGLPVESLKVESATGELEVVDTNRFMELLGEHEQVFIQAEGEWSEGVRV